MVKQNRKSNNEAVLRTVRDTHFQLARVLIKIDAPDFGLCSECDEPIRFALILRLFKIILTRTQAGSKGKLSHEEYEGKY
jgi:RNA polymerase-binding transcription factor DksA